MKIYLSGKPLTLSNNDFIAKGGQGSIYVKDDTAYKIYHEVKHALPEKKIKELSVISDERVIRPLDIIRDVNGNNIGYTMQYVKDAVVLCQLFTKSFKDRNKISLHGIHRLSKEFQDLISFIHDQGILIVDLNELNFITDKHFQDIYAIDTDNYTTPSFKSTAIMLSVTDPLVQNNNFNKNSDWYSWGIVSFQLWTGIHPFKGNHPKYTDDPQNKLIKRMRDCVSVYNKDVKVPAIVNLNCVPKALKEWYIDEFDNGHRSAPPKNYDVQLKPTHIVKVKSGYKLNIDLKWTLDSNIEKIYNNGFIVTQNKIENIYNQWKFNRESPAEFIVSATSHNQYLLKLFTKKIKIVNLDGQDFASEEFKVEYDNFFYGNNNLYLTSGDNIYRYNIIGLKNILTAGLSHVANFIPNAAQILDGSIIQNLLGRYYLSIFAESQCFQYALPDLDGFKILDGKTVGITTCIVALKDKNIFQFLYIKDQIVRKDQVDIANINMSTNDKVGLISTKEEELIVFNRDQTNVIIDPVWDNTLTLCTIGGEFYGYTRNEIYKIGLKR